MRYVFPPNSLLTTFLHLESRPSLLFQIIPSSLYTFISFNHSITNLRSKHKCDVLSKTWSTVSLSDIVKFLVGKSLQWMIWTDGSLLSAFMYTDLNVLSSAASANTLSSQSASRCLRHEHVLIVKQIQSKGRWCESWSQLLVKANKSSPFGRGIVVSNSSFVTMKRRSEEAKYSTPEPS